ncbi:cytochrome C [Brevibacillus sp. SYSU BS000544]|uniref:cytochrome C n=1 Tax=Brevibacillus sp. SYSU BS000544 TaxID=3416443 RepID=UPI003CE44D79
MGKNLAIFFLCFVIAFGGGYLIFGGGSKEEASSNPSQQTAPKQETKTEAPAATEAATATTASVPAEGEVFSKLGCITCHSVKNLGVSGGATGPDLSKAFTEVEGKHGVKIEEFLKKPTSAVMSGVIGGKPLTDEERKAVLDALKAASEKK